MRQETLNLLVRARDHLRQEGIARRCYHRDGGGSCSLGALIYCDTGQFEYPKPHRGVVPSSHYYEAVEHLAQYMPKIHWAEEDDPDDEGVTQELRVARGNDQQSDAQVFHAWDLAIRDAVKDLIAQAVSHDGGQLAVDVAIEQSITTTELVGSSK